MARIRGKDTGPEKRLRRQLTNAGVRYRLHLKTPGGRADIVIPSARVAVFIDGCFWHGCPHHYVRPRSRKEFWERKLEENVSRDRRQTLALEESGWRVVRVWEHEVVTAADQVGRRILRQVQQPRRRRLISLRVVRVEILDNAGKRERRYLEDLRNPERCRIEEGLRSTRKVGIVRRQIVREGFEARVTAPQTSSR